MKKMVEKLSQFIKNLIEKRSKRRRGYEPVEMGEVDEDKPPKGGTAIKGGEQK